MATVRQHYESVLSDVYSWLSCDGMMKPEARIQSRSEYGSIPANEEASFGKPSFHRGAGFVTMGQFLF